MAPCLAFGAILCLSLPALAQHEIRLLLASGAEKVVVSGNDLRVLDDEGERTLAKAGRRVQALRRGDLLSIDGLGEPQSAVRVAGENLQAGKILSLGVLEIRGGRGGLWLVDRLPLEEYVARVVEAEMGGGWPLEALKAQAVAARSFALRRCLQRQEEPYDLVASTSDQAFARGALEEGRVRQAVRETSGMILAHENFPAEATYSACCGGRTASAEEVFGETVPYLASQADPYCAGCPGGEWQRRISVSELARAWSGARQGRGRLGACRTDGKALTCREGDKTVELGPVELRRLLGSARLPSTRFTLRLEKDVVITSGRGRGHGVGLCQWGARGMAEQGAGYRDILRRYYPGAELRRMY